MSDTLKTVILVFSMAAVTYLVRVLPFVLFRKKINSVFIKSLLYYVPYAVLSAMTFPAILYSTGDNFYAALVGTVVALTAALFKLSLIIVALLACAFSLVLILVL